MAAPSALDRKTKTKLKTSTPLLASEVNDENIPVCKICVKAEARYTCPRCNIGYCSLGCYQSEKHTGCSEAFYKECVVSELSEMTNNPEDRQKVLDMLAKDLDEKAEEDDGDSFEDDLAERVEGLDLDKDISTVWSRLKPKEKEDFARMLQDGRLARLIELWTPWWRCKENQKLVLESGPRKEKPTGREMPEILSDVPDINIILKNNRPSTECKFDLLNVLFSYAFVSRVHNGSHLECPVDSTQDILESCFALRDQNHCGSIGEAVQKSLDDCCSIGRKSEGSSSSFNLTVLEDVKTLVSGPGKTDSLMFISSALSDLIHLFQAALRVIKKELKDIRMNGEDETEMAATKSSVFKGEKKLSFLLSWSQRYGMAAHQLIPQLQFEIDTRQAELEQVDEIKSAVEGNMEHLKPADKNSKQGERLKSPKRIAKIVELD